MTKPAPLAPTPDTSPAAIAMRRRRRAYALQDDARKLREEGVKPAAAAERLGIDKGMYDYHSGAAHHRQRIREVIATPAAVVPELTKPEQLLLQCIVDVQMDLFLESAVRSPESKVVSWKARKSNGWAVTTAGKRLDIHRHAKAAETDVPSLGLTDIAGNGYINLTDEGWRVCAALWPDRILL